MSLLNRTEDAIVYLAREEGDDVVTFAEATLRRDYEMAGVPWFRGFTSSRLIVTMTCPVL